MMKQKLLALCLGALCMCACGAAWSQQKTLTVGFTISQTGPMEADSMPQLRGIKLWRSQVNANGGIKVGDQRYKVELKFYDDQSSPGRVQQLYTRLILQDSADFLLSPYSSGLTTTASIVSEQFGKIMIATGAAQGKIFKLGNSYLYQIYTPSKKYFTSALDLVKAKNPDAKVAFVYTNMGSGYAAGAGAVEYAKKIGLNVVLDAAYAPHTANFSPIINKVVASGADVLIGGGHFADGSTLARQLYEKNVDLDFISIQVAPANPKFATLGKAAYGVTWPTQWSASSEAKPDFGPTVAEFANAFTKKYGHSPAGYHAAGGYAAGLVLQHAIEMADSLETKAVAKALNNMDGMTFYGRIKFANDPSRHGLQVGHQMLLGQWQKNDNGEFVQEIVWPQSAQTAPLIYPLQKFK